MALEAGKLVQALREASRVERCHTMPHHGTYSVGQHSYDALCLLLALYPGEPSWRLVKALLFHDVPERWLGDVPAPAFWADGEFAKTYGRQEARIFRTLGLYQELDPSEQLWLAAIDKAELLLWAKEQLFLGNANANSIIGNLVAWFARNQTPVQVRDFLENHKYARLPDVLP